MRKRLTFESCPFLLKLHGIAQWAVLIHCIPLSCIVEVSQIILCQHCTKMTCVDFRNRKSNLNSIEDKKFSTTTLLWRVEIGIWLKHHRQISIFLVVFESHISNSTLHRRVFMINTTTYFHWLKNLWNLSQILTYFDKSVRIWNLSGEFGWRVVLWANEWHYQRTK